MTILSGAEGCEKARLGPVVGFQVLLRENTL